MRQKFLFVSLLLFFVSCQRKEVSYLSLFHEETEVAVRQLDGFPINSIGNPNNVFYINDCIILSEPASEKLLSCYDIKTDSFYRFLPKGQGANEGIEIQDLGSEKAENEFYASDMRTRKIFTFAFSENRQLSEAKTDTTSVPYPYFTVTKNGDKTFYLTVGSPERFLVRENNLFKGFGKHIAIDGISDEVVSSMLQGPCISSQEKQRIAWFSFYGDVMEIYDYSDTANIRKIAAHESCLPQTNSAEGALALTTKLSVSSVATDGKYIYALYSEKTVEDMTKEGDIFLCNKILVFDWDGNAHKILNLSRPIKSICFCNKRGSLLGLTESVCLRAIWRNPLERGRRTALFKH